MGNLLENMWYVNYHINWEVETAIDGSNEYIKKDLEALNGKEHTID